MLFYSCRGAGNSRWWVYLILVLIAPTLFAASNVATQLKADERLILFPTSAYVEDEHWVVPVHGWVFEPEDDSWWRAAVIKTLRKVLGLPDEAVDQEPFRSRASMFLVDNERGKNIELEIAGHRVVTGPSQANGHFHWRANELPVAKHTIELHSANMHFVPADAVVDRVLNRVRTGNVVLVEGYLVRIDAPDNWHWKSSLRRDDVGNGACELIWVRHLEILV